MSGPWVTDDGDDLGFDELDGRLGERLRAAAPSGSDAGTTLAGLRPRLARARQRRRAMVTGASALGIALVVTVGAVALRPGGGADVRTPPATRPDTASTSTPTTPTTVPTTDPTLGGTSPTTAPGDDHGGDSGNSGPGGGGSDDSSGSGSSGSGSSGSGGDD